MQSFYSRALGRVKSSHMYSGMALRSSTVLGLHRRVAQSSTIPAIEREHRYRLWWTVYIFDRSTCSKLGLPITIQDSDIDVAMPSTNGLSSVEQKFLGSSTDHLVAHIKLAQITGYIMNDIHVSLSKANGDHFVQNVRSILGKLRKWDSHVPARLRWDPAGGVPRPVASLQLHFNQCIILTTRPILLYVFKLKNPFAGAGASLKGGSGSQTPPISDHLRSLADSCVAAARTSNAIIVQLFIENALATCGYFDAYHLFSSTLVLIVSAISSPNASDSDAVQTAFQLLIMMRDSGNAIAGEYFARLLQIQGRVNQLFARATAARDITPASAGVGEGAGVGGGQDIQPGAGGGRETEGGDVGGNTGQERFTGTLSSLGIPPTGIAVLDEYDWSKFVYPPGFGGNYGGEVHVDPLDNPLLQAFLDHTDGSQDETELLGAEHIDFVI
jgi:proline utilization trans-activator